MSDNNFPNISKLFNGEINRRLISNSCWDESWNVWNEVSPQCSRVLFAVYTLSEDVFKGGNK